MITFRRVFPYALFFSSAVLAVLSRAETASAPASAVSVPELVALITEGNPEIRFYEAEIAAAKAGRRGVAALADPELSFDVGRKRVRDAAGVIAGEGTTWSVSLMQTFEWPGRLSLRKAIANRDVQLAELGLAQFKTALEGRARMLARSLHAANAKATAVREVADRFSTLKEIFLTRESSGITPLLEARVIEAAELALQRRATDAELALQAALIELNQLRGAAVDEQLRVNAPPVHFAKLPPPEALLAAAREHNFEFRMRRVELEQQGYAVQLARHERYPAFSVGPTISQENAGDRETVVGVAVNLPLPISGRSRSAGDQADARRRQAEVAALLAERALARDVLVSAQTFTAKTAERARWSADTISKFREAAELADRHYRLGALPVGTYVELQTSYLDAVEALLETENDALTAAQKLEELTGLAVTVSSTSP